MTDPYIKTAGITLTYRVPVRDAGLGAAVRSLWHQRIRDVKALDAIELRVEAGEAVALNGPNGASKTTLIKILAGILKPTNGNARVFGLDPFARKPDQLRRIALMRGSQPPGPAGQIDHCARIGPAARIASTNVKALDRPPAT